VHFPSQYMPPNPQDRSPTRTPPREQCEYSLAGQAVHCPSQYTSLGGQIEPESESALTDAAKQRNRPMFLEPAISANYKLKATKLLEPQA